MIVFIYILHTFMWVCIVVHVHSYFCIWVALIPVQNLLITLSDESLLSILCCGPPFLWRCGTQGCFICILHSTQISFQCRKEVCSCAESISAFLDLPKKCCSDEDPFCIRGFSWVNGLEGWAQSQQKGLAPSSPPPHPRLLLYSWQVEGHGPS